MYRNVAKVYNRLTRQECVWESTWNEKGERITLLTPVKPYLYYERLNAFDEDSKYTSMNGRPLKKEEFKTSSERSKWLEQHAGTGVFEELSLPKQYLLDKYCGQEQNPEFIRFPFKTFFFDIEVEIQDVFPDVEHADYPINVISIFDTLLDKITVWCYRGNIEEALPTTSCEKFISEIKQEFDCPTTEIDIRKFDDEKRLLIDFLKFWASDYPDVISGWNIDGFDTKYIINRITKVFNEIPFGEKVLFAPNEKDFKAGRISKEEYDEQLAKSVVGCKEVKLLSPICTYDSKNCIIQKKAQVLKKTVKNYGIKAVSICDYMLLYKKFGGSSQQSFKLDYIAKKDLNKGKLDYHELGYRSLKAFMDGDFVMFVKYNIIDSMLVKKLDDERKFITIMRLICNFGLCEYENVFQTVPSITGALCIEARRRGMKFITDSNKEVKPDESDEDDSYEGAFVFPTTAGYYRNGVVSYDFNSLYPNTMITLNISPETYVGQVVEESDDGVLIRTETNGRTKDRFLTKDKFKEILDTKCTLAANKMLSLKPSVQLGIMPGFLSHLYDSRVALKKKSKVLKKKAYEIQQQIDELKKELDSLS